jgi:hypothetical protein
MVIEEKEVNKFLKEIKKILFDHKEDKNNSGILFTHKAQNEIMLLEINTTIAKEMIEKMETKDYVSGPEIDKDRPGQNVWIFGIEPLKGFLEIYIKISDKRDNQRVVCLSFHTAKSPMKHPFVKH